MPRRHPLDRQPEPTDSQPLPGSPTGDNDDHGHTYVEYNNDEYAILYYLDHGAKGYYHNGHRHDHKAGRNYYYDSQTVTQNYDPAYYDNG